MAYGMNCILAIACWSGYNQEDGIVMNYDAVHRGMFRSMAFRSYEAFEEDDEKANTKIRFGNPAQMSNWKDLKPGLDYSKVDDRGIIREGEYVDENTVLVSAYMMSTTGGQIKDASTTPQVWTRGRVEKVAVMVNNMGLRLVKIRVVQDRIPELGDKFSNRHGQKGTIGALLRGHDMPRTESGIVPDMIMNPHAIPSRMTIAQNLEQLLGKTAALTGAIGDGTPFMNDGSPQEAIGGILEQIGFEKYGNEVMYNGATGEQIQAAIFIGPVYGMRLKHMVEDKWQARGQGRKEMRTHQPTGGRGAQGGLKIGEMDRDAIIGHAGMAFVKESFMERSDGTKMPICVACGTIPIYNPKLNISICSMCDGPVRYMGDSVHNLEILPPIGRPKSRIVEVEMPYSTKLLTQEQETYLNLSMRYITTSGIQRLTPLELSAKTGEAVSELPRLFAPVIRAPAYRDEEEEPKFTLEQLRSMGANVVQISQEKQMELDTIVEEDENGENVVIDMAGQPIQGVSPMQPMMNQLQMQPMMNQQPMQQAPMQQAPMQQAPIQQAPMQQPMIQQVLPMMNQQPMPQMQPQPMQQPQQLQNQVVYPPQQGGMPSPNFTTIMQGGFQPPTFPGQGGMIVVDTSGGAMAAEGLGPMVSGGRRTRASYQGGGSSAMMGAAPPPPMMSAAMPSATGGFQNITINKLE
jgi:hypothetical protein